MSPATISQMNLSGLSNLSRRRLGSVLIAALFVAGCAMLVGNAPYRGALLAATGATFLLTMALFGLGRLAAHNEHRRQALIADVFETDETPFLYANSDGEILAHNAAAERCLSAQKGKTVSAVLEKTLANPESIVFRLQAQAALDGVAQEKIATRTAHLRLNARQSGPNAFLWRLEEIPSNNTTQEVPELPTIVVDRDNMIQSLNDAARYLFGTKPKSLDRIVTELPVASGAIVPMTTEQGTVQFTICEADAGKGKRALYLLPPYTAKMGQGDWDVFQELPVSLLKVNSEGLVLEFNRMAANLIGSRLQKDMHMSDLMEGLGRPISDWLTEVVNGRSPQQIEFLRLKRADREAFVQISLNRVEDVNGFALIAVLTDATELKTLEAQFVQSQKMQAIGQLAGGVAHDFNNLLTAISGHCDLLLLRHDQGDPDFSDLVQINQNANRAAALVGQLLAFSRKQTLRPETLDMRDTLSDLTHLLNRLVGEKVTLTLQHDPVLQPIRADKRQLEQVLMNLVVNARDAMPDGGEIRIFTEVARLTEPLERDRVAVPPGDYVTVQVRDDGVGIPPDKLQKVFEPFYTTKRIGEGTGLGLSTAYGIVKQTGGYIFVDSSPGMGTAFTLYFPVLDEQTPAHKLEPAGQPKVASKHGDGVILLVEDEAPVRAFASRALRLRGYTVLEADSAEAALETLEDDNLNVDVFVTDVVMPGMDGPTWVRQALKQRPDVRVVFVSGYAEDSFGETQTRIPNSVFLPKPFSLNDLTDTVHKQLY